MRLWRYWTPSLHASERLFSPPRPRTTGETAELSPYTVDNRDLNPSLPQPCCCTSWDNPPTISYSSICYVTHCSQMSLLTFGEMKNIARLKNYEIFWKFFPCRSWFLSSEGEAVPWVIHMHGLVTSHKPQASASQCTQLCRRSPSRNKAPDGPSAEWKEAWFIPARPLEARLVNFISSASR
jgi:hypothetical protein